MLLRFTITDPQGRAATITVDKDEIRFGSAPENDVVLHGDLPPHAFRFFMREPHQIRIAPMMSAARSTINGGELYERNVHPRDVVEVAGYRVQYIAPELSPQRRAELVSAALLQKIATRFGDDASARFVDDLWATWADGGPRLKIELFVIEPFAWVEIPNDSTPFSIPNFFWIDNRWTYLMGLAAFRQAIIQAQPDLSEWQSITRIYAKLVHAEVLLTYEEAADYADPRWHAITWSADKLAAWEPPHFDGKALRFCVEDHGALECVTIWQDTFSVDVSRRE